MKHYRLYILITSTVLVLLAACWLLPGIPRFAVGDSYEATMSPDTWEIIDRRLVWGPSARARWDYKIRSSHWGQTGWALEAHLPP